MNFAGKALFAFLLGTLLTGCASKAYLPTHTDSPDYGTITLIRTEAEPTASRLNVFVGDDKVASIRDNSHVTFSLPAGEHALTIDWPNTPSVFEGKIKVDLQGKEHRYFSIIHGFEVPGFTYKYPRKYSYTIPETLETIELATSDAQKAMENLNP